MRGAGRRGALAHVLDRRSGAVLVTLAVAAVLLASTRATWVRADLPAGLGAGARTLAVDGSDAAALVPALALVGVAGALALSTVRGVGRVLAAGLVALAALASVAAIAAVLAAPSGAASGAVRTATGLTGTAPTPASATAWPVLALLPALALLACGLGALVRGRRWTTSARFEPPAAGAGTGAVPGPVPAPVPGPGRQRPAPAAVPRAALWDELSRGGDPTREAGAPAPGTGGMMAAAAGPPEPEPVSQPAAAPVSGGAP